jgi:hypothetical protein
MQELVKREMESAAEFSVPIVAEVGLGSNWRDIKYGGRRWWYGCWCCRLVM